MPTAKRTFTTHNFPFEHLSRVLPRDRGLASGLAAILILVSSTTFPKASFLFPTAQQTHTDIQTAIMIELDFQFYIIIFIWHLGTLEIANRYFKIEKKLDPLLENSISLNLFNRQYVHRTGTCIWNLLILLSSRGNSIDRDYIQETVVKPTTLYFYKSNYRFLNS